LTISSAAAFVFSQRHGALEFHGGEPRHDRVGDARIAIAHLPKDWRGVVRAPDNRIRGAAAEGALVRQFGSGGDTGVAPARWRRPPASNS
jgi:hypothetical protein